MTLLSRLPDFFILVAKNLHSAVSVLETGAVEVAGQETRVGRVAGQVFVERLKEFHLHPAPTAPGWYVHNVALDDASGCFELHRKHPEPQSLRHGYLLRQDLEREATGEENTGHPGLLIAQLVTEENVLIAIVPEDLASLWPSFDAHLGKCKNVAVMGNDGRHLVPKAVKGGAVEVPVDEFHG